MREGEGVRVRVCVSDESFNLNLHANRFFSSPRNYFAFGLL